MNDQLELFDVVSKCIKWNSERYDRVFNNKLSLSLLNEEIGELFRADTEVEKLDAIGDIIFVALGVLWKAGVDMDLVKTCLYAEEDNISIKNAEMNLSMYTCDLLESNIDIPNLTLEVGEQEELYTIAYAVRAIFIIALSAARALGVQAYIIDIVDAICDSNATKEVKGKTDPAIKANIFKGQDFIPPTARLQAILTEARKGV